MQNYIKFWKGENFRMSILQQNDILPKNSTLKVIFCTLIPRFSHIWKTLATNFMPQNSCLETHATKNFVIRFCCFNQAESLYWFKKTKGTLTISLLIGMKDYLYAFQNIEFAVYCSPRDEQNYKIFERVLKVYCED